MKKFSILAMMLLAVVAMNFTACTPTETTIPTITVEAATTNDYAPGNVVSYAVAVATTNKELKTFTVAVAGGDAVTDATVNAPAGTFSDATASSFSADLTTVAFTYTFTVGDIAAGTEIAMTFTVEDDEETNDAVKTFTVGASAPAISTYSAVGLSYTSTSLSDASMFDAETGTAVSASAGTGDFALAWQTAYGYSVVSPDAQWLEDLYWANTIVYTKTTTTKIQKLTGVSASEIDASYINDMTVTSSTVTGGGNGIQNMLTGDMFAYETASGLKGVGTITFSKVTKTASFTVVQQTAGAGK